MELDYIVNLAKKHTDEIGFIPRPTLERYWQCGQIEFEYENDELCGFLVFGNGRPTLRIYQAVIQYDARRREHGTNLVQRLILKADRRGYDALALWCANDLEANEFWKALGFVLVTQKRGGTRRDRMLNQWVFWLSNPVQMRLF
jgi:GNAT superfamily N-acetyltransferase